MKLSDKDRNVLLTIFKTQIPDKIVLAYGSRVSGRSHEGSDLDLVVIDPVNVDQPQATLSKLRQSIHDSSLPMLVDVIDWARMPAAFREQVRADYVVLWNERLFEHLF